MIDKIQVNTDKMLLPILGVENFSNKTNLKRSKISLRTQKKTRSQDLVWYFCTLLFLETYREPLSFHVSSLTQFRSASPSFVFSKDVTENFRFDI